MPFRNEKSGKSLTTKMRMVSDLPIPPAEKMECAEGKIPEREYRGLMVSYARTTYGLETPSWDAPM